MVYQMKDSSHFGWTDVVAATQSN